MSVPDHAENTSSSSKNATKERKQEDTSHNNLELSSKSGENLVTDTTVSLTDLAVLKVKSSKHQGVGHHEKRKEKKDINNNVDDDFSNDTFLKRYKIMEKIGEGSYSEVLKCQNRHDSNVVACKRLKHIYKSWNDVNNISEIATLRTIERHVNILQMIEIHYDETLGKVSLVFELMDVNLYELIKDRKRLLPESRVRTIMFQLFRALRHLHKLGIFHRDIKPENILIKTKTDQLKLGDLGSVRGIFSRAPYTEYISTRWYRSPECLLTAGHYSHKMDIWAAGCVFYEVLTLRPLFPGSSELDQINRINNILGPPPMKLLDTFQKQAELEKDSYRGQTQLNRRQQIQTVLDGYSSRYIVVSDSKKPKSNSNSKTNNRTPLEYHFAGREGTGMDKTLPSHVSREAKEIIKACLAYDPEQRPTAHRVIHLSYFYELRESYSKSSEKVPTKSVVTICGEAAVESCGTIDLRTLGDNKVRYRRGHQVKVGKQPSKSVIPIKKPPEVKPEVSNNNYENDSSNDDLQLPGFSQSRMSIIAGGTSKLSVNSKVKSGSSKLPRKISDISNSPYTTQLVNNYVKNVAPSIKPKSTMKSASSVKVNPNNNYMKSPAHLDIVDKTDGTSSGMASPPARRALSNLAQEQIRKEIQEAQKHSKERMKATKQAMKKDATIRSSDDDVILLRKNARMEAGEIYKPYREGSEKVPPVNTICGELSPESSGKIVLRSFGENKILYGPAHEKKASKQPSKAAMSCKLVPTMKPETNSNMKNITSTARQKANNGNAYMKTSYHAVKPDVNSHYANTSSVKPKVNSNYKPTSRAKLEVHKDSNYIKSSTQLEKRPVVSTTPLVRYPPPGRRSVSNAAAEQIRKEFRDAQRKRSDRMKSTMRGDEIVCSSEDQEAISKSMRKNAMDSGEVFEAYRRSCTKTNKSIEKIPSKPVSTLCGGDVDPGGSVDLRTLGSNKIFYRPGHQSKLSKPPSKQQFPLTHKPSGIPQKINSSYMKYQSPLKPEVNNNYAKTNPSSGKLEVNLGNTIYVKNSLNIETSDNIARNNNPHVRYSHSNSNPATEQARKDFRDSQRKRAERMKPTVKDEVFCSSDDDVVITMRKKFDNLISERARKLSECLNSSNIVSNVASTEFRKGCDSDDDFLPPSMNAYTRNAGVSDKSKKYARRELRARMAESLTMSNRFSTTQWRFPVQDPDSPQEGGSEQHHHGGESSIMPRYDSLDDRTSKHTQIADKTVYRPAEEYQKNLKYQQQSSQSVVSDRIYPFSRHDQNNNRHGQIYTPPGIKPVYQSQAPSVGSMLHERKYRYNHNIPVPRIASNNNNSPNTNNSNYPNYSTRGKNLTDVNVADLNNRLRQRI